MYSIVTDIEQGVIEMANINDTATNRFANYPEKILQFGEGNFLRAFADWMIDKANRDGYYQGRIVLCQPIASGLGGKINDQKGAYTLVMRGLEDGKAVERVERITSVSRCINPYEDYEALVAMARSGDLEVVISNTTEAGIAYREGDRRADRPPVSFPAKVCAFLHERFLYFGGDPARGLLFLPVELIDDNGENLKRIVLQYAREWDLGEDFYNWVEQHNHFCSTLVDRIVTGYPGEEAENFARKLGYEDQLLVTSEVFNLWVIEGRPEWAEKLPVHKTDANVIWTDDVTPYKKRKVRILNGGHTATVLAAYLAGHDTVLDMMNDELFARLLDKTLYGEVIPTLDLPRRELEEFARAVKDRFSNPYIKHRLLDISLNSCSKWCARCMPSLLGYVQAKGELPTALTFSLAAFIRFYKGTMEAEGYMGQRGDGTVYPIRDDAGVIRFFADAWATRDADGIADAVLGNTAFWGGGDLRKVPGLTGRVADFLRRLEQAPVRDVLASLL